MYVNSLKEHLQNLICFIAVLPTIFAGELTFELPDNEKQCFHEVIDKNVKCTLEFQVRIVMYMQCLKYLVVFAT